MLTWGTVVSIWLLQLSNSKKFPPLNGQSLSPLPPFHEAHRTEACGEEWECSRKRHFRAFAKVTNGNEIIWNLS